MLVFSNVFMTFAWYGHLKLSEMKISTDDSESSHGAGLSLGGGFALSRFKVNVAYGKYHVSSSSLVLSLAYSL